MRILYIITQADGGGAQNYTLTLAKTFGGAIAAGAEAEKLFADAQSAGLPTFKLKRLKRDIRPWDDFPAIWEIKNLIKSYRPDIVHLNSSKAGVLGSFAAIGLKTKVVFTAHGFVFNEPLPFWLKNFYLALEKVASSYRDQIICVSEADRRAALANKLIDKNKLTVIHNGIPTVNFLFKNKARTNLSLPPDKLILGSLANFYKVKGLDILVDAISLLDKNSSGNLLLVIIGDGRERPALEKKILSYGLGPKIMLFSNLDQAAEHLTAFDIFVLPSRKEGFPFALLEAMQAGLPIVATKVGGIPEALGDGGLQVAPNNARALADAIGTLINDKNLAAQFAARAKQLSEQFTEQKMLEQTEQVYHRLLAN